MRNILFRSSVSFWEMRRVCGFLPLGDEASVK